MEKWNDDENWDVKEQTWKRALSFAKEYHSKTDNYRIGKNGEKLPYITHIQEVMRILVNEAHITSDDILTVAALHDVLEDTDCTYEELEKNFGKYLAGAVDVITRKEGQSAEDYLKGIFENEEYDWVSIVKLADRIHNLRTYPEVQDVKRIRFKLDETKKYIEPYALEKSPVLAKKLEEAIKFLEDFLKENER